MSTSFDGVEITTGTNANKEQSSPLLSIIWLHGLGADGHDFAAVVPELEKLGVCLLYTSPSPRDATLSRMPSSA